MENVVDFRRIVIAGQVPFPDVCGVVTDLISVWDSVREYVRSTGPPDTQTQAERVSSFFFLM